MSAMISMIGHGAEGRVYESTFMDRPVIVKERVRKSYRVPELDVQLTKSRFRQVISFIFLSLPLHHSTTQLYIIPAGRNLQTVHDFSSFFLSTTSLSPLFPFEHRKSGA